MRHKIKFLNFRFLPFMLLAAILGISLISLLDFAFSIVAIIAFVIAAIVFSFSKNRKVYLPRVIVLFITFVIFLTVGGVCMAKAKDIPNTIYDVTLLGTITSDSDIDGELNDNSNTLSYKMYLSDCNYISDNANGELEGTVKLYVNLPYDKTFSVGDVIVVQAAYIEPIVVNLSKGVAIQDYISGDLWYVKGAECIDIYSGRPNFQELIKVRARNAMVKYVPSGGIMYSMVFGNKSAMSNAFSSASKVTGIAHLFAVSGLHLGFVAGIASFISKKCKANKLVDYFLVLIVSGLYALLVGFGPSVARAFLMLTIYKSGNLFGVRHCGISSLSLSAIIILLVNPLTLFNLSFQLSVMSIVGILFFQKPICKMIKTKWTAFNTFVSVNLAVNITLLPIMLHYFGSVSLIFLFTNLLIVPFVTLIFPFILIFVLLSALHAPIAYLLVPFGFLFSFAEIIIIALAKIPFLAVNFSLNFLWVAVYIAFLVVISTYSLLPKKPKAILASLLCLIIMVNVVLTSFGRIDGSIKLETILSNEDADIVMLDIKNDHYLFVNGDVTMYNYKLCCEYMTKNNVRTLQGLVIADITAEQLYTLSLLQSRWSVECLITSNASNTVQTIFDNEVYESKKIGEYTISASGKNILSIAGDDCNVVFVKGDARAEQLPIKIDIMYCNDNVELAYYVVPTYFVSDEGVEKHIPKSVNSYFTFIVKGGKIKVA